MAIVKMKQVHVVGPADRVDPVLDALQDIALLDPVPLAEVADAPASIVSRRQLVGRVVAALEGRRAELKKEAPEPSSDTGRPVALATVERVEALLAERAELESRLAVLGKERDLIAPWGNVDPRDLDALAADGVFVDPYIVPAADLDDLDLSGARYHQRVPLEGRAKQTGLIVVSLDERAAIGVEPAPLPDVPLADIEREMAEVERRIEAIAAELGELSATLPAVRRYDLALQDELRHHEVRAGAGGDEELFALAGWCPADRVDDLRRALDGMPVALLIDDPGDEDEPPIKLKNPPLVAQFQPLLGAFALPNYREFDPTLFIAPFMGLFFGFCLGDMGYGIVLTAVAGGAMLKYGASLKGDARLAVQWLLILGICTVVVGGLTGNVFGVKFYEMLDIPASKLLFSLNDDPKKFFYASLIFGVIQLTAGLLIKLVRQVMLAQWQAVIGTLGWLSVFPAIGVWVVLGSPWAFVAVLLVILLFAAPSPSIVRRVGGGAWALYNITGLVGDVMSYARIFGLGLSSGIIAGVVNTIALTIAESIPYGIGWVIAVLVLIAGHSFNFVMAMIGSVVHPARLQFLEFFGKFFEGGGRAYAPFGKLEGE